ncbi:MAG: hemolysin XhlA family protein [Paracoccus sp. (in: a-proteobacteria)]
MSEHAQDQLLQVHRRLDAHDSRLKSEEARMDAHDGRIRALETQQAVTDERAGHIKASLDEIRDGQRWLIRLVIGGILAGILAFLIRGGFHVGS